MSKINIKDFIKSEDTQVSGALLIKGKSSKVAYNGKPFLDFVLTDGVMDIGAKMWNVSDVEQKIGDIVFVEVTRNVFNDKTSLVINSIELCNMDVSEFRKHGPNKAEQCYDSIIELIGNCKHEEMKKLTLSLIKDNKDRFLEVPAAIGHHHNYLGGNCQHTYEVLFDAIGIADLRTRLASEPLKLYLVCCGAALHDIGKLWCYKMNGEVPEMTTIGKFKDHLVVGSQMLNEKAIELGIDRTQEWFMMLDHIILSHHGKLEWGSPVAPCFPEAFIVHQADMNSSKLSAMKESIEEITGEWGTKRDYSFGSFLYAGDKE